MKKYICIRLEKLTELLNNYQKEKETILKNKKVLEYSNKDNNLIVEVHPNSIVIIKSLHDINSKALVNITDNTLYKDNNINNLVVKNIIIEGTDGVGKTSTIKGLIEEGIVCFDRDLEICKYMLFDVDLETRCQAYKKYLESTPYTIIFLINNSKDELTSRINTRSKISDFDKLAFEYNTLYKETFYAMQKYESSKKLKMIDCTNLTLKEQINKVKEQIMEVTHE